MTIVGKTSTGFRKVANCMGCCHALVMAQRASVQQCLNQCQQRQQGLLKLKLTLLILEACMFSSMMAWEEFLASDRNEFALCARVFQMYM